MSGGLDYGGGKLGNRVTLFDQNGNPLGGAGGTSTLDDAAFTPGVSSLTPAGFFADEVGTDPVDEGDIGAPRMTLDRIAYSVALLATDALRAGSAALVPKFAKIDCSTSGDNTIVAAVPSKKIRVLAYDIVARAVVTVVWKSGAATTLSGPKDFDAKGGMVKNFAPTGHLETAAGQALVLNLSGAIVVGGELSYIEV